MMFLPVFLGAAALGAFVYHARTTPHGKIMASLDAHLSPKLRSAVAYSIQQGTDAKQMVELAKKLQPKSPVAAAMVATRAKQLAKPAAKPALVYSSGAQSRSSTSAEISDPHSS